MLQLVIKNIGSMLLYMHDLYKNHARNLSTVHLGLFLTCKSAVQIKILGTHDLFFAYIDLVDLVGINA